jgi:hypothetical protein
MGEDEIARLVDVFRQLQARMFGVIQKIGLNIACVLRSARVSEIDHLARLCHVCHLTQG